MNWTPFPDGAIPPMNRREFIRSTSLAAAGLAFAGASARLQARTVGANDRVRVGLIGFGDRMRRDLLPALRLCAEELNCEVVAVSDLWKRRRDEAEAWFKKEWRQSVMLCRNNDELYEFARPDAVIIATADFQHALHTIEAVKAGCDVYVETPFAETMADARAALQAVRAGDRIVQIGAQRRSGAGERAAQAYLQGGEFGPLIAADLSWHVNEPGRWRRPDLVAALQARDIDWKRFLLNRPAAPFDPRKYVEYRLFWPYSSGIPGQWLSQPLDTLHRLTGLPHPRSVTAAGGVYQWRDGRTNADTLTAVLDYGPLDDRAKGFQVVASARLGHAAGGTRELYYSNGGELDLLTGQAGPRGGLDASAARAMGLPANEVTERSLRPEPKEGSSGSDAAGPDAPAVPAAVDSSTAAHVRNWLECVRARREPAAPVETGYQQAIACIMVNAAARTGERASFDTSAQEVLAGGTIFQL